MRISIKKLDDDDPPHVELLVSDGDFAVGQNSYIYDEEFLEFGVALKSFPLNLAHEVIFESGSPDPKYHCYIRLRAFVYDGVGHCALEAMVENHLVEPYSASAHFYILCEAATLNRLGQLLESWTRSSETEFGFSTEDAS